MRKTDLYLFGLELILVFWYIKDILYKADKQLFAFLIVILIYLCGKVLYYIFERKKQASVILAAIILYLLITSIGIFDSVAYFVMMNVLQLVMRISYKNGPLALLSLTLIFFIDLPVETFVLVAFLSYLSVYVVLTLKKETATYKEAIEDKERDVYRLTSQQLNMSIHESNLEHATRLEERNSIAQKLHDELGHTLSGSTMQLEAALLLLDKDADKSKLMFRKVINNLREGTESIRKILKAIKPETVSMNIQTIKTMASKVKERSGVAVNVHYSNDVSVLSFKQWQLITVNIQEALTNMMKYADASKCDIYFEAFHEMFKVTIKDNGVGCDNIQKNMGLEGMNERMLSLGGQLILDGSYGFSLVMLMPIEKGQ